VTVVALAGGVDPNPFLPPPYPRTEHAPVILDLRYGSQLPEFTPPTGATLIDGKPILLMQGGLAFAWWFGAPVPWQAMRRALDA
jgi:shikimate 5-dehydrogenase